MSEADTADPNPTTALLSNDDGVDAMSDMEVKDTWVRGQLMYQIIKANRDVNPRFMASEDCDRVEQMLSEGPNAQLKAAAIQGLNRSHNVAQSLGWEDGPGNIETLLDILTKDGVDTDAMVPEMRENIKSALGGCGMPRINVYRARVKAHTADD